MIFCTSFCSLTFLQMLVKGFEARARIFFIIFTCCWSQICYFSILIWFKNFYIMFKISFSYYCLPLLPPCVQWSQQGKPMLYSNLVLVISFKMSRRFPYLITTELTKVLLLATSFPHVDACKDNLIKWKILFCKTRIATIRC